MTRTLVSALALAGAMMLSGAAMAQTMVGAASVTDEDLPKVQAACDTLASKADTASGATNTENASDSVDNSSAGDTEAGVNAATTTSIDLALLTIEDCKAAGLVK